MDLLFHACFTGKSQTGPDARFIDVHSRHATTDFARQEQRRAAGAAADVKDVVGGSQFQEPEKPPVLQPCDPAALAEVLSVGLAAHLFQGVRSEVAVGRAVKIHGRGHDFLRDADTADRCELRFASVTSPTAGYQQRAQTDCRNRNATAKGQSSFLYHIEARCMPTLTCSQYTFC